MVTAWPTCPRAPDFRLRAPQLTTHVQQPLRGCCKAKHLPFGHGLRAVTQKVPGDLMNLGALAPGESSPRLP